MSQTNATTQDESLAAFGQFWTRLERSVAHAHDESSGTVNVTHGFNRSCLYEVGVTGMVEETAGEYSLAVEVETAWIVADSDTFVDTEGMR